MVELATAVIEARPLELIASVALESTADAPVVGGVNRINPPATGSSGASAVTCTLKGLAKLESIDADCGEPPLTRAQREPLALESADIGRKATARHSALVGGVAACRDTGMDGRTSGEQGHRFRRPAVISQWREIGIEGNGDGAGQVTIGPARTGVGLADQVASLGNKWSAGIGTCHRGHVARHDCVSERQRAS